MTNSGYLAVPANPEKTEANVVKVAQLVTAFRAAAWNPAQQASAGMDFEISCLLSEFDKIVLVLR